MSKAGSDTKSKKTRATKPEPFIYGGSRVPDWFAANPTARALAKKISDDVAAATPEGLAEILQAGVYNFLWKNRVYEYADLPQNQKTAFGEYLEILLIKALNWTKNSDGLDVRFLLMVDGELVVYDTDIKASCSKINRPNDYMQPPDPSKKKRKSGRISMQIPMGHQISKESRAFINILISVDTYRDNFSLGILDCAQEGFVEELKKPKEGETLGGPPRDQKSALTTKGKEQVLWILHMHPMMPNHLINDKEKIAAYWAIDDRNYTEHREKALKVLNERKAIND